MPALIDQIHQRVMNDGMLIGTITGFPAHAPYSGLLNGGFYRQPLKRGLPGERGATPRAFVFETGVPRVAGVIRESTTTRTFSGIPTTYQSFFHIYLYGNAVQSDKEKMRAAARRLRILLEADEWRPVTDEGFRAFLSWSDQTGILDSEEFAGGVYDMIRFEAVSRWTADND